MRRFLCRRPGMAPGQIGRSLDLVRDDHDVVSVDDQCVRVKIRFIHRILHCLM